uniref:ATP synthase subunit a n=1 Tax=Epeurysa nawaii TaxID=1308479 RepID=A0A7S5DCM2_9HEMI|nr:ATP synthase F0 subunit 6 [Epeurysa nawaii]QBZ37995.1 ATP synthase F0 subunit 6 [Epeurysa nawaii]QBZ38008.1 ATP synthase F0 subunit 6 [Epeurysa nawaii]
MMTNLFSSFDPSTTLFFQLNWMTMICTMLIIPNKFWLKESRNSVLKKILNNKIYQEMKFIYPNEQILMMLKSTFMLILILNLMGLIPYVFTPTSHLSISISLALPMWLTLMFYSWTNSTNLMFAHLLPMNTPMLIAPFMIVVESLSNLIRPISLSVRLSANMIAGHLLMTLLGNINQINTVTLILMIQMFLMMFEIAVSLIQAYVFSILMTMYSSEIP